MRLKGETAIVKRQDGCYLGKINAPEGVRYLALQKPSFHWSITDRFG